MAVAASNAEYADDFVQNQAADAHHGIPAIKFFEDIPGVVASHGVQKCLERLNLLHMKYKFWESKFVTSRAALLQKVPEFTRAIQTVKYIESVNAKQAEIAQQDGNRGAPQEEIGGEDDELSRQPRLNTVNFELADQLFARAQIRPSCVCIWLGASVMVEYEFSEAIALLESNLNTAQSSLQEIEQDLVFIRDQINIAEVNMTRVYNHDVKTKRQAGKQ
ncbi:Prefoldin subunit 3 [Porphyridium purpureum]|uniref:Prefoldin subunit 3 n=1 Tax=Porphyridium purpureum TaxID=35688 RepID=A0A5J4YHN0_PORPP|nr:Prefoldin subunit 3 [Porphyridium purpureum]|eukprot:POR0115..scf289_17